MIDFLNEKLAELQKDPSSMHVDSHSEGEEEQGDGEPDRSGTEREATGASRPGRPDPTCTEPVSLVSQATDFRGRLDIRYDGVRFDLIGGGDVTEALT